MVTLTLIVFLHNHIQWNLYKLNIKIPMSKIFFHFICINWIPVYSAGTRMSLRMGYLIPTGKRMKCGSEISLWLGYLIPMGKKDTLERVGNVHIAMAHQWQLLINCCLSAATATCRLLRGRNVAFSTQHIHSSSIIRVNCILVRAAHPADCSILRVVHSSIETVSPFFYTLYLLKF